MDFILFSPIKICDFGMARLKTASSLVQSKVGTMLWMAPEVIEEQPYDAKADIYSYALVLYELVTKTLPFQGLLKLFI